MFHINKAVVNESCYLLQAFSMFSSLLKLITHTLSPPPDNHTSVNMVA